VRIHILVKCRAESGAKLPLDGRKVSWTKQHSAPTTSINFSPSNDKVSIFIVSLAFIVYNEIVSSFSL